MRFAVARYETPSNATRALKTEYAHTGHIHQSWAYDYLVDSHNVHILFVVDIQFRCGSAHTTVHPPADNQHTQVVTIGLKRPIMSFPR
jgi:hypothetical protein